MQAEEGFDILSGVKDKQGQQRKRTMETESMKQRRQYKQWLRQKRKETAIEIVSAILFLLIAFLLIKLWFAYEGFEIQW